MGRNHRRARCIGAPIAVLSEPRIAIRSLFVTVEIVVNVVRNYEYLSQIIAIVKFI